MALLSWQSVKTSSPIANDCQKNQLSLNPRRLKKMRQIAVLYE